MDQYDSKNSINQIKAKQSFNKTSNHDVIKGLYKAE